MKIYSIFTSIMGEVNRYGQGSWASFIRLAGCNLRCSYCDTVYAQKEDSGKDIEISEIVEKVREMRCPHVLITGGEPMSQFGSFEMLVQILRARGILVSVETNGTIEIPLTLASDSRITWILDYKLFGSGYGPEMFKWDNVNKLDYGDWVKFVISNKDDYKQAKEAMDVIRKQNPSPKFAFSACDGKLSTGLLWQMMRKDQLFDTILNVQIHKAVNLPEPW
jgi:7-carboxy-7-deazaguanine synthase